MTCEHKSFVYIIQGHKMFLRRWAGEQIIWVGAWAEWDNFLNMHSLHIKKFEDICYT